MRDSGELRAAIFKSISPSLPPGILMIDEISGIFSVAFPPI